MRVTGIIAQLNAMVMFRLILSGLILFDPTTGQARGIVVNVAAPLASAMRTAVRTAVHALLASAQGAVTLGESLGIRRIQAALITLTRMYRESMPHSRSRYATLHRQSAHVGSARAVLVRWPLPGSCPRGAYLSHPAHRCRARGQSPCPRRAASPPLG